MGKVVFTALLLIAQEAFGAAANSPVTVHVDWINIEQLHCKGCRIQTITMDSGSYYITTHEREGKMIYTKISGRWSGASIQVSVSSETRRDDGTFADGEVRSVVVAEKESKELHVGDIRLLLTAAKATEAELSDGRSAKDQPKQPPDPTTGSVPPPPGAGGAPSASANH